MELNMKARERIVEELKRNLGYEIYMTDPDKAKREDFAAAFDLICHIATEERKFIPMDGEKYPYDIVKNRILKLEIVHMDCILRQMKVAGGKDAIWRNKLLTIVFEAPALYEYHGMLDRERERLEVASRSERKVGHHGR